MNESEPTLESLAADLEFIKSDFAQWNASMEARNEKIDANIERCTRAMVTLEGWMGRMNPLWTLQYFAFDHLSKELQEIARPFGELAARMTESIPPNAELDVGLRKLLEAKDCFVRAFLAYQP